MGSGTLVKGVWRVKLDIFIAFPHTDAISHLAIILELGLGNYDSFSARSFLSAQNLSTYQVCARAAQKNDENGRCLFICPVNLLMFLSSTSKPRSPSDFKILTKR